MESISITDFGPLGEHVRVSLHEYSRLGNLGPFLIHIGYARKLTFGHRGKISNIFVNMTNVI